MNIDLNTQIDLANTVLTSGKWELSKVRMNNEGTLEKINLFIALYEFFAGLTFGKDMRDMKNMGDNLVTLLKQTADHYPFRRDEYFAGGKRIQDIDKEPQVRFYLNLYETYTTQLNEKGKQIRALRRETKAGHSEKIKATDLEIQKLTTNFMKIFDCGETLRPPPELRYLPDD